MSIRDAGPGDFPQILALNQQSVDALSPLNESRLQALHADAAYHRVYESAGRAEAFLLVLREGSAYDSPNYRWFVQRHPAFLYIDRIVVSADLQGRGVGRALYADLLAFAASSSVGLVTCEYDVEPLNAASQRFHDSFGFREVGTQAVGTAGKRVSLQALKIAWRGRDATGQAKGFSSLTPVAK